MEINNITVEWVLNHFRKKVYAVTHAKAVVRGLSNVDKDLSNLENKVTTVIQGSYYEGDNTNAINLELIDARNGVDGVSYNTAGDAIRTQIQELKDVLDELKTTVDTLNNNGLELKDEIIREQVNNYISEHPETVVAIPNESITIEKLSPAISDIINSAVVEDKIYTKSGAIKSDNQCYAEVMKWEDGNYYKANRIGEFVEIAELDDDIVRITKAKSFATTYGVIVDTPAFATNLTDDKLNEDGTLKQEYAYVCPIGVVKVKVDNTINNRGMLCVPKVVTDENGKKHCLGIGTRSTSENGFVVLSIIDDISMGSNWAYVLIKGINGNKKHIYIQENSPTDKPYVWFQPSDAFEDGEDVSSLISNNKHIYVQEDVPSNTQYLWFQPDGSVEETE